MSRHMRGSARRPRLSAIVTGGTAGIGEAIVRLFRAHGARVVAAARERFRAPDVLVDHAGMDTAQ